MNKLINHGLLVVLLSIPFSLHAYDISSSDPLFCQKFEERIDQGVMPDGFDMHNYYDKCGFENVPVMADTAVERMEGFIKEKMGDRFPSQYSR